MKTQKIITVDEIMALKPCKSYSRDRIEEMAGSQPITAEAVRLYRDLAPLDKIWLLSHWPGLDEMELRGLTIRWADRIVNDRAPEADNRMAIYWLTEAERYTRGEIKPAIMHDMYLSTTAKVVDAYRKSGAIISFLAWARIARECTCGGRAWPIVNNIAELAEEAYGEPVLDQMIEDLTTMIEDDAAPEDLPECRFDYSKEDKDNR